LLASKLALPTFFLGTWLVASGARADAPRVLVVNGGASSDVAGLSIVREAMAASPTHTVVSAQETDAVLDSVRALGVNCDPADAPCAARVGALGGVDLVVVLLSKGDHISLKLIDVASSAERAAVARQVTDKDHASACRSAVVELITPERYVGTLVFAGAPAGATVLVDAAPMGTLPFDAGLELKPGSYDVAVVHEGKPLVEKRIDVIYGASAIIDVTAPAAPATAASSVDGVSLMPTTLLIAGGLVAAVSVATALVMTAAMAWVGYLGCAGLPGASRSLENAPDAYIACFGFLGIYDDAAVPAPLPGTQLLAIQVGTIVGLVFAAVGGAGGAALLGASFFVE
jgi:hypothetical protein